ncbi:MAG: carboxymuconolactone decarboxylase family protein [Geminicoccaceae bacterium]|nr:carboxymuconolactone decarboxylase family protein [Geminicoccaceae bacterium]
MTRVSALAVCSAVLTGPALAQESTGRIAPDAVYQVSEPLGAYTDDVLFGKVWPDAALARRDRSLITLSALIASGNTGPVGSHTRIGLENGLTPEEIAELAAHLAFYAGWPVAIGAVYEIEAFYKERGISVEIDTSAAPLELDADSESARKAAVARSIGSVSPSLGDDTDNVLFADLWRRPGLAPRDRSLATVAALIAMGQAEQLGYHLNRALDAGLSLEEAREVPRHLAYYTGWPRAVSAVTVMGDVFKARAAADEAPAALGVLRREGAETFAGPQENFTGTATVGPLFTAPGPAALRGGVVRFEAGARTAWHTHPLGQTLYVTEGCAWVQTEGGEIIAAGAGDIVQIPPETRHWHGASPDAAMEHLALLEAVDGNSTNWMEKVDAETYSKGPADNSCG